jgi:hypothetical protein
LLFSIIDLRHEFEGKVIEESGLGKYIGNQTIFAYPF